MTTPLRVGIIGLGPRWRRYRSALVGLRPLLEVRGLCDQVQARAERQARRWRCQAVAGPLDLLERDDVEAVLLLNRQWYGLWPIEQACRLGKPVFCATGLAGDEDHLEALRTRVRESGLPVLMALPAAEAPALGHLRDLLAGPLGGARLVRVEAALAPGPRGAGATGTGSALLQTPALLSLLHGSCTLLEGDPVSVRAQAAEAAGLVSLILEYDGGRVMQVTLWAGPRAAGPARVDVAAEKGTATVEFPVALRWRDGDVEHSRRTPAGSARRALLERFVRALREGRAPQPDFEAAWRCHTWVRAASRSLAEGRAIALGPRP